MKIYFLSSIAFLLTIFISPLHAQVEQEQQDYVVLTMKIPQLKPIFLTAEALAEQDGKNFGKFEVVICGKTVKDLTDKEMMKGFLDKAEKVNVDLVICEFSLKKFGVDKKDISPQLRVVKNGILYNLQLQKKGYTSISI